MALISRDWSEMRKNGWNQIKANSRFSRSVKDPQQDNNPNKPTKLESFKTKTLSILERSSQSLHLELSNFTENNDENDYMIQMCKADRHIPEETWSCKCDFA